MRTYSTTRVSVPVTACTIDWMKFRTACMIWPNPAITSRTLLAINSNAWPTGLDDPLDDLRRAGRHAFDDGRDDGRRSLLEGSYDHAVGLNGFLSGSPA